MWENVFHVEGLLFKIGSKAWGLLILNFWLLVTSLPLITIGSSLTAAYYVAIKMIKDDDYRVTLNYFNSFKQNFKKSTALWLILLIIGMILGLDWFYLIRGQELQSWLTIGVLIVTALASQLYQVSFFYLARYQGNLQVLIKGSLQIMFQQPVKSLLLVVIFATPFVLMVLSPYMLVFQLYISLFFGLSFNLFLRTYVLLIIFQKYE